MGTWAHDAFGNDTACDWAAALVESADLSALRSAIDAALAGAGGYLEAPIAEEAIAASDVIARLRGHAGYHSAYTEAVDEWVQRTRLTPPDDLVRDALHALNAIGGERSELKELWAEAADADEWLESLTDLRTRLLAAPRALAAAQRAAADHARAALVERLTRLRYAVPPLAEAASAADLHKAILAASALGELGAARDLIARLWQPLADMGHESILWDLAVREAQTWALEGQAGEALAQLQAWRESPAANERAVFDYRAAVVCLAGQDLDGARKLYDAAIAAAPEDAVRVLDLALLEARVGSLERAAALFERVATSAQSAPQMGMDLVGGIIAARRNDRGALPLLENATRAFLAVSEQNPGGWPILSYCAAWWAIELAHAGERDLAAAVLAAIAPILHQPHNRELIETLSAAGLLARDDAATAAAPAPVMTLTSSASLAKHAGFSTFRVRGPFALKKVEALRREFERGSRLYPFLVGTDDDLAELLELLVPPADGGSAALATARGFDAKAWLAANAGKGRSAWPKEPLPPRKSPLIQFDALTQHLHSELVIGLVELGEPSELFARLGYGDWNACPPPHVHSAVHAHWQREHGATPITLSGSTVECVVERPPSNRKTALALAREQHAYCDDIVEQGVGTVGKLGSALLDSAYWYFWWD